MQSFTRWINFRLILVMARLIDGLRDGNGGRDRGGRGRVREVLKPCRARFNQREKEGETGPFGDTERDHGTENSWNLTSRKPHRVASAGQRH